MVMMIYQDKNASQGRKNPKLIAKVGVGGGEKVGDGMVKKLSIAQTSLSEFGRKEQPFVDNLRKEQPFVDNFYIFNCKGKTFV